MTEIINLTPHAVNIINEEGEIALAIPSTGMARCAVQSETVGDVDGIPVNKTSYGEVNGLPDPSEGTMYVVSMLVAQALKGERDDLVYPGELVRDEGGNIVGCRNFAVAG